MTETAVVLWLDLASTTQMNESVIRGAAPAGATLLRLTDCGAEACVEGKPELAKWPVVLDAIDRLVRRARAITRGAARYRYWVTGRASLPAFVYLGRRLSKFGAVSMIHQPSDAHPPVRFDLVPTDGAFFQLSPMPLPESSSRDPVALSVSTGDVSTERDIKQALLDHGVAQPTIVGGHAPGWVEPTSIGAAMRQVQMLLTEIKNRHAERAYVAVFVASAAVVALAVGLAINERVCRDIRVFVFDGHSYARAYDLPYPTIPERAVVLYLFAQPDDYRRLELSREIREVRTALSTSGVSDRIDLRDHPFITPSDIHACIEREQPGVLHFSGHGHHGALVLETTAQRSVLLSTADLVECIRLYGRSIRLVVLDACYSDSHEALLKHVDCVIAMSQSVDDHDAIAFARELYRVLAQGDSVRVAFDKALYVMRLERASAGAEWMPRDLISADGERLASMPGEPPRLLEHDPGCADEAYVVRRRPGGTR